MNIKIISRTISSILFLEAIMMLPSLIWCFIDREWDVIASFVVSVSLICLAALLLRLFSRHANDNFQAQEGFLTVALSWIVISAMGALPFFISGQIPNYVDAFFETVSGFTTTGASILSDVESMSRGLLYWRSFTHWLGGMGILVFALAVMPSSKTGSGKLYLMQAESPGPSVGKLTPRLHTTAGILYGIYVVLTLLCILFLVMGGMPFFESLCTAFGTAGTGGFGVKNDSITSYSPYIQNVCTIFMLLFGVNFNIYYLALLREGKSILRDEELRLYLFIFLCATGIIAWNIRSMCLSWEDSLRHAAFQVSSIMTTTGFCTTDFNLWPPLSKAVLLCLMVLGACAGSTGGGIKTVRVTLMSKILRRDILKTLNPRSVVLVHMNGRQVEESVLRGVSSFIAAYIILVGGSFLLVSADGISIEGSMSAVLACINNVGPGLAEVGPMSNFQELSEPVKLVLAGDMLLGRLEIFPLLSIFSRHAWNRRM